MSYVIVTSRPWNESMARRLAERTGEPFHLITRKEDLTPERLREIAPRMVFFGPIYAQRWLEFQGHELIDELRTGQAAATHDLCRWFVDDYPHSAEQARPQQGEESLYPRRRPVDSRLDPRKSLAEQFDLLRVVDNKRYPAFFEQCYQHYKLIIEHLHP